MNQVAREIARAAPSRATVLIRGESGVGKELVARAVHFSSPRKKAPFGCINCAALSETLLESELFGHEKGAFTGATERKVGKFEAADKGTLMLDEIGEMSPKIQAKFLRVLEGHPFERVGGSEAIKVDVRVIAATNRDLEKDIAEGRFRLDLFYRLNVVPITLPRLADHAADVMPLARHFAVLAAAANQAPPIGFAPAAEASLLAHDWPGNIRELSNLVERLTILYPGEQVEPHHLPQAFCRDTCAASGPMEARLEKTERDILEHALRAAGGHKARAAEGLGISRHALKRRLKRLGML
jgi:Nif-specific regulatory protein